MRRRGKAEVEGSRGRKDIYSMSPLPLDWWWLLELCLVHEDYFPLFWSRRWIMILSINALCTSISTLHPLMSSLALFFLEEVPEGIPRKGSLVRLPESNNYSSPTLEVERDTDLASRVDVPLGFNIFWMVVNQ
jgi:hypothetical protein